MYRNTEFCETCRIPVGFNSYQSHLRGKRHQAEVDRIAQTQHLLETGLYIKGVPFGVTAAEIGATFGRFGCISKVEIYGDTAYVNYFDRNSCEEALKHQHIIRDQTLMVDRRIIQGRRNNPSPLKRSFDSTKQQQQTATAARGRPAIEHSTVLSALADPSPISEQMATLKRLILAGDNSAQILQSICNDMIKVLTSMFKVCELFSFGSMTTGLAFKDSDLDVYAHLEFNKSTHLLPEASVPDKIFVKAKSCFFRKPNIFSNIIPIQKAKTPLIKVVHVKTQVACDVSFKNAIGYHNSSLLRHYLNMNEKFFDLMVFIKYWARVQGFCSSSRLSNFSLCMLGLSYFLSLKDAEGKKIVPPVQDLLKTADPSSTLYVAEWNCSFDNTPITVTLPESPDFSLTELLKNFFQFVAGLPFQTHVVSVLTGELISRDLFEKNPRDLPDAYEGYKSYISKHPEAVLSKPEHCAVIHDPFKLDHNLLERVKLATMQAFLQACKTASEEIAVAMNSSEMQSSLFHHLLDVVPLSGKQGAKVIVAKVNETVSVIMNNPFVGPENPYDAVRDFMSSIYEKILLFKVISPQDMENESKVKVRRTDTMQNIHDDNSHFELICEGQKGVWIGRKKAKKQLRLSNPLNFQEEEKISHLLAKTTTDSTVKFQCEVICKDGKLHLNFRDLQEGEGRHFNAFMSSIKQLLPKWITGLSAIFYSNLPPCGSGAN